MATNAISTTTSASPRTGLSHKRENLFMFVDWANAYKQARKLHKPESFSKQTTSRKSEAQSSDVTPEEQSTTNKNAQQKSSLTLEQLLAEFINGLKKYDNTNLGTSKGIENLFSLLEHMDETGVQNNMKKLLGYREELTTSDRRKQFLGKHCLRSGNEANAKQSYVLWSNHLQLICCQWDQYKPLPYLNHCFIFLSHRPGAEERIKNNQIYKRMIKKYNVLLYERITTSTERKAQAEDGRSDKTDVVVREKEKGVDVSIGVKITDIIRRSVEKKENEKMHIVLVSGDSDFKPVIEYALNNKVSIDVWAWENGISAIYKKFLKEAGPTVHLFHLDRYLYQLGCVPKLIFKYEVILKDTDETRGNNLSHFTVAEQLTNYSNSLKECNEELNQLHAQLRLYRESEEEDHTAIKKKLSTLKLQTDFFPSNESLLSKEEKDVKNKIQRLQKSLKIPSENSKKIDQILVLIKQTKEKRQQLEKEHQQKEQNEEALNCKTYDFRILWGSGFLTIAFFTEAKRLEFLDYRNNFEENFAELLRKFDVETRERSDEEFRRESEYQRRESICSEQLSREDAESDDNDNDDDDDSDVVRFEE